jgi:hypothetical protein
MTSEREIESVVHGFETCETAASQFKHRDHLVVAVWYVHNLGSEAALERMREGLLRFIDHHGIDPRKYSEETTRLWIERVTKRLGELGDVSVVEKCNAVLTTDFTDRDGLTR